MASVVLPMASMPLVSPARTALGASPPGDSGTPTAAPPTAVFFSGPPATLLFSGSAKSNLVSGSAAPLLFSGAARAARAAAAWGRCSAEGAMAARMGTAPAARRATCGNGSSEDRDGW
eukprot:scaffold36319_cov112-Isochrysis_galbana.AAC.3